MTTLALGAGDALKPPGVLRESLAMAGRAVAKIRRNPDTLIDVTLQPIIFLLLFTFLFGGAISGDWRSYLQVLVPGLMVQNTVFASLGIGVALNTDITKGVFDRFRSLPIARSAPIIGAVLGDIVRQVVALAWLLIFASILGFRIHTDPVQVLLAAALMITFGLCMCWISVFVGMLVRSPNALQGVMMLPMFPLTFGSNVFMPNTGTLPGWLQWWTSVNPISKLTDVARGLTLGGPVASPLLYAVAWMAGIVVVFFPLAMWAYRKRLA